MTMRRIPLKGRMVRTVSWHGHIKLVSDPMRVVEEMATSVVLEGPHGRLWAYRHEVELVGVTVGGNAA